jgi:monoamine oxidase
MLVGWVGGSVAEDLSLRGKEFLMECALGSLESVFRTKRDRIRDQITATYMHDWQADPFTVGAYSYVPVGGLDAQEKLASSVAETIFFAGEATSYEGHNGTVHGAIGTGVRAAKEILNSL